MSIEVAINTPKHPTSNADFYKLFTDFKAQFDSMEPEVSQTVSDTEMGIEGYVVVWNTGISKGGKLEGCAKGGTRIIHDLELEDVRRLARSMALKNAAAGLPLGGAKAGLKFNPKAPNFEKTYRRFVSLCKPHLYEFGGKYGGFGFDIGAEPIHALWACDELGSTKSFTGKPLEMGGTDYDREGLAGMGVAVAGKAAIKTKGQQPSDVTFAVQGLGAMGAAVFRYFSEYGGHLRALSDPLYGGTWRFEQDPSKQLREAIIKRDAARVNTLLSEEATNISADSHDVLYQKIDVLFPCAMQDTITLDNVDRIQAALVCEGANNPTSIEAYTSLFERDVMVVPDFIANVGGIIAAYVEMTSDVTPEDNIKTGAKVKEAKDMTISKISANVEALIDMVKIFGAEPSHVGQYMAYRNILSN
jgi:glutamate dehydrogenase (NAD(P)+)